MWAEYVLRDAVILDADIASCHYVATCDGAVGILGVAIVAHPLPVACCPTATSTR